MSSSRKLSAVAMAVAVAVCVIAAMCLATPASAASVSMSTSMSSQLQRKRDAQARLQTMNEAEAETGVEPTHYPNVQGGIPVGECAAKMKEVYQKLKTAGANFPARHGGKVPRVIGIAKIGTTWNFAVSGGLTGGDSSKNQIKTAIGTTWNFPNESGMQSHPSGWWHCAAQQLVVASKRSTSANPTCLAEMYWEQRGPTPVLANSCRRCQERLLTVQAPPLVHGQSGFKPKKGGR